MFPCEISGCQTTASRKDNITQHLKRYHPQEYKAQRQKKLQGSKHKPSNTAEVSESSPVERMAIFDPWLSASSGNIAAVEALLTTGFNINCQAGDGNTVLHCAAYTGQIAMVEFLLSKGALLSLKNKKHETVLFTAAVGGSSECVSLLLQAKATLLSLRPERWDGKLCFADHIVRIGDASLIETLIRTDIDSDNEDRVSKTFVFAVATAKIGQLLMLRSILKSDPAAFSGKSREFRTPIYYATRNGHVEAVRLLLPLLFEESGPDTLVLLSRALIHVAARNGHLEIVKILLAHFPELKTTRRESILREAATGGKLETVKYLLSIPEITAGTNLQYDGCTALYVAAKRGYTHIVQALLDAEADPNIADALDDEDTPLMAAFWNGHIETVRVLFACTSPRPAAEDCLKMTSMSIVFQTMLECGLLSITSRNLWRSGAQRKSLLYLAAELGDIAFTTLVLNHKEFDPREINKNFAWADWRSTNTVLHIARKKGHTELAELLIAYGAKEYDPDKPQDEQLHDTEPEQQPSIADQELEVQDSDDSDLDSDLEADPYSYFNEYLSPTATTPTRS